MPDQRPRPGSRARAPTLATRPTGRIGRVHIPNAGTSEGTRTWNYGRLADGGRGARFILMGHGVHDVVEDDAESKSGKLLGVLRAVRPFPGVAEMHVGADGHHDAPVIVADGAPLGHVAILLISAARVDVDLAGDLELFIDVV